MLATTLTSAAAGIDRRALVFETGDPVMETLQEYAAAEGFRAASFTALGAFREATLAYFDWESKEYRDLQVDEQVEVTSLVGDIGIHDGEPAVHVHCVLGRSDGSAVTGHLMEATVRPTLELFLTVYPDASLDRLDDQESGLHLIRTGKEFQR